MTIKYKGAIQCARKQVVQFDIGDLPLGVFVPLFTVPMDTLVIGGTSYVKVAAGGTTNVLDYGTSGAPNELLNDDDAKTVGFTALAGKHYPTGAVIGVTRTETGTPSVTGQFIAVLEYAPMGVMDEIAN
jgi:hypothetical protein